LFVADGPETFLGWPADAVTLSVDAADLSDFVEDRVGVFWVPLSFEGFLFEVFLAGAFFAAVLVLVRFSERALVDRVAPFEDFLPAFLLAAFFFTGPSCGSGSAFANPLTNKD
jgi:hypothetical protein